jgi:primosomal protein N'
MGWFKRKPVLVNVNFRELTSDRPIDEKFAYVYQWNLPSVPVPGTRVLVPGGDGKPAHAIVAGLAKSANGLTLKAVMRLVTQDEIDVAIADVEADALAWLDMARKGAGLPTLAPVRRRKPPERYDAIPPATGEANAKQAAEYARVWYRASKLAEERGLNKEEISTFRGIAHRWYAIRDREQ